MILLGLAEKEKTLDCLCKGFEERDSMMPWLNTMPDFDSLCPNPRFQNLLVGLGLQ